MLDPQTLRLRGMRLPKAIRLGVCLIGPQPRFFFGKEGSDERGVSKWLRRQGRVGDRKQQQQQQQVQVQELVPCQPLSASTQPTPRADSGMLDLTIQHFFFSCPVCPPRLALPL